MSFDDATIKSLVSQAEELGATQYLDSSQYSVSQAYASIAVLTWEASNYFTEHPSADAQWLLDIVAEVKAEEYKDNNSWDMKVAFPYDNPNFPYQDDLDGFPQGLAISAATGNPTLSGLESPAIVHEWTTRPGEKLFHKFAQKFKEVICGKSGPYEQLAQGKIKEAELPTAVTAALGLAVIGNVAACWMPIAALVALLLVNASLKTYCEP